jgi:hypothetical protein
VKEFKDLSRGWPWGIEALLVGLWAVVAFGVASSYSTSSGTIAC